MYLKKTCKITLDQNERMALINAQDVLSSLESLFYDYSLNTKEWNEDRIAKIRLEIESIFEELFETEYIIEGED